MLFWKENKKQKAITDQPKMQDKMAKRIAGILLSVQERFSTFMSNRIDKLSIQKKRGWLVLFCLVFGGLSIYAFIGVFRNTDKSSQRIKPDRYPFQNTMIAQEQI